LKHRVIGFIAIVLTALSLVAAACGGTAATTTTVGATTITTAAAAATTTVAVTTTEAVTTTTVAATTTTVAATTTTLAPFEPTEPSVMVNGGWLAYECRGEGSPTVVIDLGLGDTTRAERDPNWWLWYKPMDLIAETNKVCVYGRRGMVGSEPVSADPLRTTQDHVDDLNGLIDVLELETPVILVGHSLGGFNIRLLAGQHPEMVAGLVFVDGSDPGMHEFSTPYDPYPPEWVDLLTSGEQVAVVADLGDLPVYVLTAVIGQAPDGTLADVVDWWLEVQDNLIALSTNSIQTKVDATHGNIWWAKPEVVAEAVAWVTAQAG